MDRHTVLVTAQHDGAHRARGQSFDQCVLGDRIGHELDALADSSSWAPHVVAGKLRLLATWGEKRTKDFPNVPTLREQGYDVVVDAPNGVGAPKGLDPAVEKRLRDAFKVAAASKEFLDACDKIDAPPLYLDGPEYLLSLIHI